MTFLARAGLDEGVFFSQPHAGLAVRRLVVAPGAERALLPTEAAAFAGTDPRAQRRSATARLAARELFEARFGLAGVAIGRAADRSPLWPSGFVGSLAHDDETGVAALARSSDFASLGVDIEPNAPLGPDLVTLVATPLERRRYAPPILESRLLFVIKEAVYKALYPLDGRFLEFYEVEVDLDTRLATTPGRTTRFHYSVAASVAAVAFPA